MGQTDWARLWREQARVVIPPSKKALPVRIDRDVVNLFRLPERGHQARINEILRSYIEAERGRTA